MYDFSTEIESFRAERIRLSKKLKDKLFEHRKSNQDRLISRIGEHIIGVKIGDGSFKPQGSVAMRTVIQTKFKDEEYDIDVGVVFQKSQLVDSQGNDLSTAKVRSSVLEALKDKRFSRQPVAKPNCIRVFYAEQDEEKHHVDFPIYRTWKDEHGERKRELASSEAWIPSDPTQVTKWFEDRIVERNRDKAGHGTQLRHLVQLLKRFCRSRKNWLSQLPNGMKLTMLAAECHPEYSKRIDLAFRELLNKLATRLATSKTIQNLAHPDKPRITRSDEDPNVVELANKIDKALEALDKLDCEECDNIESARRAWDWVFKSDGFFRAQASVNKSAVCTPTTSLSQPSSPSEESCCARASWREPLRWPTALSYYATINGRYSRVSGDLGFGWKNFSSSESIAKGLKLRFVGQTNTPYPYRVYWQVVNTGPEAVRAGCLRGNLVEVTTQQPRWSTASLGCEREERTRYSGVHSIQYFIIKDGICVASSDMFYVRIV